MSSHSIRFTRAAEAESERLLRQQERAKTEVKKLERQLQDAQAELDAIKQRLMILHGITSGPPSVDKADRRQKAPKAGDQCSPLSGSKIRELAVRVLRERNEDRGAIHYRRWLEILEDAGYAVVGKRPDAVFLGQLMRSPVVKATTRPGYYELDEQAPELAQQRVRELEAQLSELSATAGLSPKDLERNIERQQELTKKLRQAQRSWKEAVEALDDHDVDLMQIAA
jgi:seryl-tRNA synthetase